MNRSLFASFTASIILTLCLKIISSKSDVVIASSEPHRAQTSLPYSDTCLVQNILASVSVRVLLPVDSIPHTKILLQSVYPVGKNDVFSLSVEELNRQIEELNAHVAALAGEYQNVEYINTAALLTDASGALNPNYNIGDGIHLTNDAYRLILEYLCQHIQ